MTYMNAEMELVAFAAEDVLATSNGNGDPVATETTCSGQEDYVMPPMELE